MKHDRPSYRKVSQRSVDYFDSWLARLGISQEKYQEVAARLEAMEAGEAV